MKICDVLEYHTKKCDVLRAVNEENVTFSVLFLKKHVMFFPFLLCVAVARTSPKKGVLLYHQFLGLLSPYIECKCVGGVGGNDSFKEKHIENKA